MGTKPSNTPPQHKGMKYFLIAIALVVVVSMCGRLLLKSSFALEWVKKEIEYQVSASSSSTIEINNVSGDIWGTIYLRDIKVKNEANEASFQETRLRLSITSLLFGSLKAYEVDIANAHVSIHNLSSPLSALEPENNDRTSFAIDSLTISDSSIDIELANSSLTFSDLNISGSLEVANSSFAFGINEFETHIFESNFGDTVTISSKGSMKDGVVSLDEILIATGKTIIEANGSFNTDSRKLEGASKVASLSWEDIKKLKATSPIKERIETAISIRGELNTFDVQIDAKAPGLDSFSSITTFKYDSSLYASRFEINGSGVDTRTLFADTSSISIQEYSLIAEGYIPLTGRNRTVDLHAKAEKILFREQEIDSLLLKGKLDAQTASLEVEAYTEDESLKSTASIKKVYDDTPEWNINGSFANIDTKYWGLAGTGENSLNGTYYVEGTGWNLNQEKWTYEVNLNPSLFCSTDISKGKFVGWIDDYFTNIDGNIVLEESIIEASFGGTVWEEIPKYTFKIEAENFDIAELTSREAIFSNVHILLQGTGEGLSSENISLDIESNIYEGTINGQPIEGLTALAEVRDSILTIENAELKSSFADGTINTRQNYIDFTDPSNRATYNLNIKDIAALAPFFGVDSLYTNGNIKGEIDQTADGFSAVRGSIDLSSFGLNDYLKTGSIKGAVDIIIGNDNSYNFSVQVKEPKYNELELQDFLFASYGKLDADSAVGRFDVRVNSENINSITQSGSYTFGIADKILDAQLSSFDFTSNRRSFSLDQPMSFRITPASLSTDTLFLSASENVYLQASTSYEDSLNKSFFVKGSNLDIGIIQEIVLKERIFDGQLLGEVRFMQTPNSVDASGTMEINKLVFKGTELDQVILSYDVLDEQLIADISSTWGGEEKVKGSFVMPYLPGDPNLFDQSFFERTVSGSADLKPTQLNHFESALSLLGIENTDGLLTGTFQLSGTAGDPEFIGSANLSNATLSGVRVDSLTAFFDYVEDEKEVEIRVSMFALGQLAANIDAELPFYADFKNMSIDLPQDTDSLSVLAVTDDLNLSVLSDFISLSEVSDIRGFINGEIEILGTVGNPKPTGTINLDYGAFALPGAQTSITDVYSDLTIENDRISIDSLVMFSGEGGLIANGEISLEGIRPSNINMAVSADNFRIAYTRDAEVAIDATGNIEGQINNPKILGDVLIKEGFYFAQEFGDRDVESVELDIDTKPEMNAMYDSLSLDINVVFDDEFVLKNRLYLTQEVKNLQGELSITKASGQRVSINGAIWSEQGFAKPLGKVFDLEEARYTFVGNPTNPEISSVFMYQPPTTRRRTEQGINIYYLIEGTLEDPKYVFESEPELDQRDIIAYILFGKPYYSLNSVQQSLTSVGEDENVDDEALKLLLTRAEALATQQLGVDLVEVSTFRQGTSRGTAIQTGWYVNERTFFRIINEIGSNPKILFVLEYLVNQNLDFIITQGNDRRQGIDLQWIFDY